MAENFSESISKRVEDLISQMTLEEKISQMVNAAPAIPRLGIPEYNWWNEALHGVAVAGIATVFPQSIGMAASFDDGLLHHVAVAISDEARAKYNEFIRHNDRAIFKGLTFWSPNINIFRDPRWGRGQETYGEDPYLTAKMGVAFVKGIQGNDPKYLKAIATPKHYAVHSGPESIRHEFNAEVSVKDLKETYLYAFKECVKKGKAASIMGAYNRVNGEPCCASKTLLQDILRKEWGFDGYVVSDCGAIYDIYAGHKIAKTLEEAAAMAVKNGCDLNCGDTYNKWLVNAVKVKAITEEEIDKSVKRLFTARFKLGMFDPPEKVPYSKIPYEVNDSEKHRRLALKMARESIVLLKNDKLLPLDKNLKSIAVIGPNADKKEVLLGNYNGNPSRYVTVLDGIRAKLPHKTKVYYTEGCNPFKIEDKILKADRGFSEAISFAERSDVVIMCLGLSPELEGEEGTGPNQKGDRDNLSLPGLQEELLEKIYAVNQNIILVLLNGSPLTINWAQDHIPAILEAWYPGEEGGTAVADVIFGNYNPGGRLPVTFVKSEDQLPSFTDYSMKGRTYRYMNEKPLYPFGYGLSYTKFGYKNLRIEPKNAKVGRSVKVTVEVENVGKVDGDEVVQLYLKVPKTFENLPNHELKGFKRIHLTVGERKKISFLLTPR